MPKPANSAFWADTAAAPDIVAPSSGKRHLGWLVEAVPHTWLNWWMNLVGQWTDYLGAIPEFGAISAAMDLTNGVTLPFNPYGPKSLCSTGFVASKVQWVEVGASGAIQTTTNGQLGSWNSQTSGTAQTLRACASNASLLVAVGATNGTVATVVTSPDGSAWTVRTTGLTNVSLTDVDWSPTLSLWCAVASADIFTSPDGITWTNRATGLSPNGIQSVTWCPSAGLFVAITNQVTNDYYTSPDGITWTHRTLPFTPASDYPAANGSIIVLGDNGSHNVYSSVDGITWTSRTVSGTAGSVGALAWNGSLFTGFASALGVQVTSIDGITWTARASFSVSGAFPTVDSVRANLINGTFLWYATTLITGGPTLTAAIVSVPWQSP